MEVLLVLVLGILVLAWGLRALAAKIGAHPSSTGQQTAAHSSNHNPYVDPVELRFRPSLNNPDATRRIEECAGRLHNARQRLAEDFGRKAFADGNVEHGHNPEFLQAWKATCEVVRAKYGDDIIRIALKITGYREPSHFDIEYGGYW